MTRHVPVLLAEVLEELEPSSGMTVLDGTVGSGGHARALATAVGRSGTLVGIDADSAAVETTREALAETECETCFQTTNFRNLDQVLKDCEVSSLDGALFDLGFRSEQLEDRRGLSFQRPDRLQMTYKNPADLSEGDLTAEVIVNQWKQDSIEQLLVGYGNEQFATEIATAIAAARKKAPLVTTTDLVEVIKAAVPDWYVHQKLHPATKTFQALRVAVNDEIQSAREGIGKAFDYLKPGGRIAVISFESVTDRAVKELFSGWRQANRGVAVTDSPITPTDQEVAYNPRARSGKLRVLEKQ